MAKRDKQRRIDEVLNTPIRPAHYNAGAVHEVYKCLESWGLHTSAYLWTCVVYLARAGKKDPLKVVEDLKKARWYLDREIELQERQSNVDARNFVSAIAKATQIPHDRLLGKHVTPGRKHRR